MQADNGNGGLYAYGEFDNNEIAKRIADKLNADGWTNIEYFTEGDVDKLYAYDVSMHVHIDIDLNEMTVTVSETVDGEGDEYMTLTFDYTEQQITVEQAQRQIVKFGTTRRY